MGLVEGIPRERLDEREHLLSDLLRVPLAQGPCYELLFLLGHDGRDLLAHGLADDIGLSKRVPREGARDQQYLVLEDDNAIGLFQYVPELGVWVPHVLPPVLCPDEGAYVLHGPRPVQGDHCRHVPQRAGLELLDVPSHARALQLEHSHRFSLGEHLECPSIVERDVAQREGHVSCLADELQGLGKDRQVDETQKVDLEKPELGYWVHRVLRGRHALFVALSRPLERDVGVQRLL